MDIIVRANETCDQVIERCAPEGTISHKIVGGFPVGSWWERDRGLVIEYTVQEYMEQYTMRDICREILEPLIVFVIGMFIAAQMMY